MKKDYRIYSYSIDFLPIVTKKKFEWKIDPTPKILKEVKTKNGKC